MRDFLCHVSSDNRQDRPGDMGRVAKRAKAGVQQAIVVKSGDTAPDFILTTVGGRAVSLRMTLRDGRSALLVFLRHLG